jgi:HNH endonuclease
MNFHDLFSYDPETGILTWKVDRGRKIKARQKAGSVMASKTSKRREYWRVQVNGRQYYVHRIIYEMMTGHPVPPGMEIDHIDRDSLNNKWSNLRLAAPSQNQGNRLRSRDRTQELPKGIHLAGWGVIHLIKPCFVEGAWATLRQ